MIESFTHKGKQVSIRHGWTPPLPLNNIQLAHINGELDIYEPIIAYEERYDNKGLPIPGTKRRNDLPPVYLQWKQAYVHKPDLSPSKRNGMDS
jgi:hypothetical protein